MNIIIKELEIKNGERKIYGKLYSPEGGGIYPAVILCHGYNGVNTDWVKECSYYAHHGYVAYAFDFCGGSVRSKSSGYSTDMTITSEKEDLFAVLDSIRAMDNVDAENVVLFGGSQGGLVSALAAAERADEVRALAMYFPALCIPGDATGDGRVNALDLVRLKKYLSGADVVLNKAAVDVTGDGRVNALDLVRLKKYLSGADVELG